MSGVGAAERIHTLLLELIADLADSIGAHLCNDDVERWDVSGVAADDPHEVETVDRFGGPPPLADRGLIDELSEFRAVVALDLRQRRRLLRAPRWRLVNRARPPIRPHSHRR